MKTDVERGPFTTWAYHARRAKYGSADKAAAAISAGGYQVDGAYLRGIEAGHHKPGADLLAVMEAAYESTAPQEPARTTEPPADLVAALTRQTEAMEAQTAAIGELVGWLSGLVRSEGEQAIARGVARALAGYPDAGGSPRRLPPLTTE